MARVEEVALHDDFVVVQGRPRGGGRGHGGRTGESRGEAQLEHGRRQLAEGHTEEGGEEEQQGSGVTLQDQDHETTQYFGCEGNMARPTV